MGNKEPLLGHTESWSKRDLLEGVNFFSGLFSLALALNQVEQRPTLDLTIFKKPTAFGEDSLTEIAQFFFLATPPRFCTNA